MKKFSIITNALKDPELLVARDVQEYLQEQGAACDILEFAATDAGHSYKYTDPAKVPGDVDCVIVLGGDGTVLRASRDLVDRRIPLFGINLGTLGYLAEVGKENIRPALERLVADQYIIEERMMLEGMACHGEERLCSDVALNDIALSRSGHLRVIDFHIYVNGRFLNSYSADGIIISTPTGSTGYNLSAGGPIVSPAASLILLTPIAPHTLNARSVILPEDSRVKVEIGRRGTDEEEAEATFDGDTTVKLGCGDCITVTRSERTARFVKLDQVSFLEILRRKMSES